MAAVVALNVADAAAAGTVNDDGTVSVALVLVRVTAAPPVGAACVRVTVQVLEAFGPRLVGLQTSEETSTDAVRVMVALAEVLL
jgi:hypothetical protein